MNEWKNAAQKIASGGIGVIPTDTLYGVVASALSKETVERVYAVRGRPPEKPCIILLPDIDSLAQFDIVPTDIERTFLEKYWPGAVSVVLPCPLEKWAYLHRGTETLAFRVPGDEVLRAWLRETGPIIAPSANPEGKPPARTREEAEKYFADTIDFCIDGGALEGAPSTLVSLREGKISVLREGVVVIGESIPE